MNRSAALANSSVTQELLHEHFYYDNGWLYRKLKTTTRRTGWIDPARGYVHITFLNEPWLAHRLIFIWHHGWTPKQIDHINEDPSDNRIENLRACTGSENCTNRSRAKGAYRSADNEHLRKPWFSTINIRGKRHYLGHFATEAEAHDAYLAAKAIHHPGAN